MNRICLLLLLIVVAGCKGTDKAMKSDQAAAEQGIWERIADEKGTFLKLHAIQAIQTAAGNTTPILYVGCGKLASVLLITANGAVPESKPAQSRVGVALDQAAPAQQKWYVFGDDAGQHWSPMSAEARLHLLMQMLDAKTLRVELTSDGGSPQTTAFNIQGFRNSFASEATCAAWRDPNLYK